MTSTLKTSDPFTTFILRVNTSVPGWQKTINKVLSSMHGVNNFKMSESGEVRISGRVTPKALLKVLAKTGNRAIVLRWQFGQCSSNLFLPVNNHAIYDPHGYDTGYYNGYGYDNHYQGGYGGNRFLDNTPCPFPVYPAECGKKKTVNHSDEREDTPACCTIM